MIKAVGHRIIEVLFMFLVFGINTLDAKNLNNKIVVKSSQDLLSNLTQKYTKFEIRCVVDLNGAAIVFPSNCELILASGRIVNGTIRGNKTKLTVRSRHSLGVLLEGSWISPRIEDSYFFNISDNCILSNINNLQSKDDYNVIYLNKGEYNIDIKDNNGYAIRLLDHAKLINNSCIQLQGNNHKGYFIVYIADASDVEIKGGIIRGDIGKHSYIHGSTSEWGMGVGIIASSRVKIHDVLISHCTGDGIYIGGYPTSYIGDFSQSSRNIIIKNVIADSNRRQGMSVISVDGLLVEECSFINTGSVEATAPSDGIDIEPNVSDGRNNSIRNVIIRECVFRNNAGYDIQTDLGVTDGEICNYENVIVEKCVADGQSLLGSPSTTIRKTKMESVVVRPFEAPVNIYFTKCKIFGRGIIVRDLHPHKQLYINKNKPASFIKLVFDNCRIKHETSGRIDSEHLISIECKKNIVNSISVNNSVCILPKSSNKDQLVFNKNKNNIIFKNSKLRIGGSSQRIYE